MPAVTRGYFPLGPRSSKSYQPANVEWFQQHWCPSARFDLVTNLPDLPSPGWTKHIIDTSTPSQSSFSNIVLSRQAKFLAWKALPYVSSSCRMAVYFDGYLIPRYSFFHSFGSSSSSSSTLSKFQLLADQVQASKWGLAQVEQPYFNGMTMPQIFNKTILETGKDTTEHAQATLTWVKQQDDYQDVMVYYLNRYFAYDPNNLHYREISSWFWNHYTTYGGSWRDEPFGAYAIHHFGAKPIPMTHDRRITRGGDLFTTGGTIGWNQHVHVSINQTQE